LQAGETCFLSLPYYIGWNLKYNVEQKMKKPKKKVNYGGKYNMAIPIKIRRRSYINFKQRIFQRKIIRY